jgi:hypothetical protein
MGNCLKTQLKEVVNNPELVPIGYLRFKTETITITDANAQQKLFLEASSPVTITSIDGGYFADSLAGLENARLTSKTFSTPYIELWFPNGNYTYQISDKYSIKQFGQPGANIYASMFILDIDEFAYTNGISSLVAKLNNKCKGNLKSLVGKTALSGFNCEGSSVYGDIANLSGLTGLTAVILSSLCSGNVSSLAALTNIENLVVGSRSIVGDTASLAGLNKMVSCTLSNAGISGGISGFAGCTSLVNLSVDYTSVAGEISSLADAMNIGRSSGTLHIYCGQSNVTHEGNPINHADINFSNGSYTITDVY